MPQFEFTFNENLILNAPNWELTSFQNRHRAKTKEE